MAVLAKVPTIGTVTQSVQLRCFLILLSNNNEKNKEVKISLIKDCKKKERVKGSNKENKVMKKREKTAYW